MQQPTYGLVVFSNKLLVKVSYYSWLILVYVNKTFNLPSYGQYLFIYNMEKMYLPVSTQNLAFKVLYSGFGKIILSLKIILSRQGPVLPHYQRKFGNFARIFS